MIQKRLTKLRHQCLPMKLTKDGLRKVLEKTIQALHSFPILSVWYANLDAKFGNLGFRRGQGEGRSGRSPSGVEYFNPLVGFINRNIGKDMRGSRLQIIKSKQRLKNGGREPILTRGGIALTKSDNTDPAFYVLLLFQWSYCIRVVFGDGGLHRFTKNHYNLSYVFLKNMMSFGLVVLHLQYLWSLLYVCS